jgi:hypothetical protein
MQDFCVTLALVEIGINQIYILFFLSYLQVIFLQLIVQTNHNKEDS